MGVPEESVIREDLKKFREEIVHEFHAVSEGLLDQIKLLAEGHSAVVQRLDRLGEKFGQLRKENEHQHIETRALIKISFSELDRRLSDLESQVKELQEWKERVETRLGR